jgi:quercetin dioxygenase-like cupin family protein
MQPENLSSTARVFCWDDLSVDHPADLIDRRRIIGERMMISHVTLHEGFHVPLHSHCNEQFAVVLSGRVRFSLVDPANGETSEQILGSGEVLWVPGNVVHGATAEETSVILDLFSPISQTTGVDQPDK